MVHSTVRRLVRAARHFGPTWRYGFNLTPTLTYRLSSGPLQGEAARVLVSLNRDGVAITSASNLLESDSLFDELCRTVESHKILHAAQIAKTQEAADDTTAVGRKTFILEYLGHNPQLDPLSVYARLALQKNVLGVANAYLGMRSRLRYYNVWHTFPTQVEARESQLWHRDREDHLIVKVFLYLSDVNEGAGPFTYARGSHPKGYLRQEAPYSLEGNVRRSSDAQMAEVISPEQWFRGIGPKGTIIFADTRGYHKGGLARERSRLMFTAMFTSAASESEEFMIRQERFDPPADQEQAFALAPPKRGWWLDRKRNAEDTARP